MCCYKARHVNLSKRNKMFDVRLLLTDFLYLLVSDHVGYENEYLVVNNYNLRNSLQYSRFAITRVIVLESSYLFLTEGMYTSGYIT
jgi:hypothetical protein